MVNATRENMLSSLQKISHKTLGKWQGRWETGMGRGYQKRLPEEVELELVSKLGWDFPGVLGRARHRESLSYGQSPLGCSWVLEKTQWSPSPPPLLRQRERGIEAATSCCQTSSWGKHWLNDVLQIAYSQWIPLADLHSPEHQRCLWQHNYPSL